MKQLNKEILQGLTRPELSEYCRNNGIRGYSGKTKADRINLILNFYKSEKQPVKKPIKKIKKSTPPKKIIRHPKRRYFEFYGTTSSGGESKKFWEVWRENIIVYVRFGRIGSSGRIMQKNYNSIEQAEKALNKQIMSKISKGYYEKKTKKLIEPRTRLETIQTSAVPKIRIKPMLASQNDAYLDNPNYILQQKYDGTRCIIIKKKEKISMIGRSWKNNYAPNFPEIVNDIKKIKLNIFVLDSELTFFKGNKDIFLTALAKEDSKKGYIAKCMVFDLLEYDNKDIRHLPLKKRIELLEKLIPKGLKHLEVVKSYKTNHKRLFENIISDETQGEGVVLKNLDSKYTEAARNKDWVKVKGWKSSEAVIVGVTHGFGLIIELATTSPASSTLHSSLVLPSSIKINGFSKVVGP